MNKPLSVIALTVATILGPLSAATAAQGREVEAVEPLQSYDSPPKRIWPFVFIVRPEVEGEVIPPGEVLHILDVERTGGLLRGPARLWYRAERSDGTTTWLDSAAPTRWITRDDESSPRTTLPADTAPQPAPGRLPDSSRQRP